MKKKVISLIAALCMAVTALPAAGLAANAKTITDDRTGESISYECSEGTITVSGDVSASAPVIIAAYDESGKMLSAKILNESGAEDISGTGSAKLMWLGGDFTAKSRFVQFIRGEEVASGNIFNFDKSTGTITGLRYKNVTKLIIPETIDDVAVTGIGDSAFSGCSELTSVTIPEGVTGIGESAFSGCSSLMSVTLPEGVVSIGGSAFDGCSSLESLTFPESVTSIGAGVFRGCSSLASVTIPSSVTSISGSVFYGCSALTSLTIPASVTYIGIGAFYGCSSLTSVTLPEGLTIISWSTFEECSALTSVTIPEGVVSIGSGAFDGCSSLASVTIPTSVTDIGAYAFQNCGSLKDIYYAGSEAQWRSINIVANNDPLESAVIHYNSAP